MLFAEIKRILSQHKKELVKLGARSISLFGSTARNEGTDQSDVDILVNFDSKKGLFLFVALKTYLEKLLNCEVDLVTKRALHPTLKKRILGEAKNVF